MLYFDSAFTQIVAKSPINNWLVLIQVMAWPQTGDKPLSESMMAMFTDTYMSHLLGLDELRIV